MFWEGLYVRWVWFLGSLWCARGATRPNCRGFGGHFYFFGGAVFGHVVGVESLGFGVAFGEVGAALVPTNLTGSFNRIPRDAGVDKLQVT
jgi:hypothetical protein